MNRPTQWCPGMVVVPKQSGSVRICADFRRLNESVMRETFEKFELELTQTTILALYDPEATLNISADASAFGLEAVLLQQRVSPEWRPVAYASRAMSDTEQRYSQIEKETLAIVWACERLWVNPLNLKQITSHFTMTHLDQMPPRILPF